MPLEPPPKRFTKLLDLIVSINSHSGSQRYVVIKARLKAQKNGLVL